MGRSPGSIVEAIDLVKHLQSLGNSYPSYALATLSDTYLVAGQFEQALNAAEEGLSMLAHTGEHGYQCQLLYCRGEALSRLGRLDAAVRAHSAEIDLARKQGAKLYELRATNSLARLLTSLGRCDEACNMLAEIYNWFTEGFDTADLKDAKAMLGEITN